MIDPIGPIILELRADTEVSDWTTRVRGGEPAPDDAQGHGKYRRFIVVTDLDPGRIVNPRVPVAEVLLGINVYGTSREDAAVGFALVSAALHRLAPRLTSQGFAIYASLHEGSGATMLDPDTKQPMRSLSVLVVGSTVEVV